MADILRLLIINPHPDDESFFFGGTISKYCFLGVEVHVLTLTNGEKGKLNIQPDVGANLSIIERELLLGKLRKIECIEALKLLGVKENNIYFAGISNLRVNQESASIISKTINSVDPQVILSFNEAGTTRFTNQDHSWSAIATYAAILKLQKIKQNKSFQRYLTYTFPNVEKYFDEFNELKVDESKLTKVNVEGEIKKKKHACKTHKTQNYIYKFFSDVNFLNIALECYIERINLCKNTSQGTGDIFYGLWNISSLENIKTDGGMAFPMPLQRTQYISDNIDIYPKIVERTSILGIFKTD